MHIVHCLTHSIHGGGQAVPYLLVKNFLQFYPHVTHTVILPSNGIYCERFRSLGVSVVEFPFNTINPLNFFRIRSVLSKLQPDIIHTHGRGAGLYVRTISKDAIGAKRVHTHHGFHLPENNFLQFIFKIVERFYLTKTDIIISVSQSEAEIISNVLPASKKKIKIIQNVVDFEEIQHRASLTNDARFANIVPTINDIFTVIMIGRKDAVKNYRLAFKSAENVLTKRKDIIFFFVGINSNDSTFVSLKKHFPTHCYAFGSIENPLPLLAHSSALLLTSKREGAPLTVLEAFALGKPVIGTKVRGIRDYVHHEENGLLVEENSESVAKAIIKLKDDDTLYRKLSVNALSYNNKQSVEQWVGEYYSIYTKFKE